MQSLIPFAMRCTRVLLKCARKLIIPHQNNDVPLNLYIPHRWNRTEFLIYPNRKYIHKKQKNQHLE